MSIFGRVSGMTNPGGNGQKINLPDSDFDNCNICNCLVGKGDPMRVKINAMSFHLFCLQDRLKILGIEMPEKNFMVNGMTMEEKICIFLNNKFQEITKKIASKKVSEKEIIAAEEIKNILLNCFIVRESEFKAIQKEILSVKNIAFFMEDYLASKKKNSFTSQEKLIYRFLQNLEKIYSF